LIAAIVKKGWAERLVSAAKEAGAEGATIMFARGTGIHEQQKLWGIPIEPEKELVFTIVPDEKTQRVMDAMIDAGQIQVPGNGICFVVGLKQLVGAVHLSRQGRE
jgi:nitrogen regulatory protein PII